VRISGLGVVVCTLTVCLRAQAIAPIFKELSEKFPAINFVKVDVDDCQVWQVGFCGLAIRLTLPFRVGQDVAQLVGVSAMPTFQVWQNGKKINEAVGANKVKLSAMCELHSGAAAPVAPAPALA
jgi:thioredoxin 1